MGAKVEGEGYRTGHYAVGDLNAGANGWRSPYEEEEKTSEEQLCNGSMTTEAIGCTDYDREMFKRTMLAHEAVFRQQVYELHRVYRIQSDLMKHYRNKEMHACPRLGDASQRNSPPQVPLHGAKTAAAAAAAVNIEKSQSLKFLREGSVQSSPNGFPSSDAALHTKQAMFDLERGADNCFEDDNASDNKPIDFLGVSSDAKHQSDSAVTLAGAERFGRLGHNSSTSFLPTIGNLGGHHVADLNEPILGTSMGRPNGSVSGGPLYSLDNSWQQSAWRSSVTNNSFNKEYTIDKRTNEGTSSNFFDTSSRIKQEEKPFIDKGKHASNGGFVAPRYSDTDARATFNVADGRSANINQFMYQYPNSSTGWYSRSPLEGSALNMFSRHDHPHGSSPNTLVAPIPSPHIGHPSVASRVGSCIVDPRSYSNNAGFQSFPSFNGSSTVNSYACLGAANQSIGTFRCNPKGIDKSDGRYSGAPLDSSSASRPCQQATISSDLKQNKRQMFEHPARQCHDDPDFANGKGRNNFNLNEALSDGQEDIPVEQDRVYAGSLQHIEGEGSVSGISWLSKKASFGDSTGLEEPRKVFENSSLMEMKVNKGRSGAALAVSNLPDSASTSVGCGAKKDKTQESAACLPPSCQNLVPRDGQAAANKSGAAIVNFFDLNDDIPNEDNSESSIVSHECHATSLQNNHAKRAFVIDLEVPACEDAAATAAAEDIIALSMDVPTTDTPENMLQWFADLAVSSIDDDDLETFESLTLKLEETKAVVEFCSRPVAPAVENDEQTVSPVNLLTKPKRGGNQRKRRQKRDFQKDILPSISSLCRPEIIEDIQLLEGLVQTTGGSWESSFTRRRRSRGKKPKKKVEDTVEEEVEISPPPSKPDESGLEAEDRGMIGWGRTTRRCRRQRCPSGMTIAAAS
ncbi:uncharacterized protein LOC124680908 [Lolium rigidum]|uniref:uncharacterized protein LOC124680908 n=1 Tax=Lolium rigidum TaxID=89674 RepID=UPI001F5CBA84|nr:uncharacterized protein LOC124680908 [Lolium rigidum]